MSDWKNNSVPDYTKGIVSDYCELGDAPLILMNIAIDSNLGAALKSVDNRICVHIGSRGLNQIIHGEKLLSTRIKDILLNNKGYFSFSILPHKEFSCEADEAYFVHLIKEYLEILDALSVSKIVRKSPNTIIKNGKPGTFYTDTEIFVVELIEWAIRKKIPIDEELLVAYSMALPATDTQPKVATKDHGVHDLSLDGKELHNKEDNGIKKFIEGVIKDYPDATSKDIVSHCFDCYKDNNRTLTKIKKIIADFGVEMDIKGGKRSNIKIKYMERAPIFKLKP